MADRDVAGNILQILAGLPEFLRKPMLKNRLQEFFEMPEEDQKETVTNALDAAPSVDFAVLSQLVKTWMEILCEFDENKRKAMFGAYVDVIASSPELISGLDVDGLINVYNSLPENDKKILAESLRDLIAEIQEEKRKSFVDSIPDKAKETIGIS